MKEKGPWAPYPLSTQEKMVKHITPIADCVESIGPRYDNSDLYRDSQKLAQSCLLQVFKRHKTEDGKMKWTKARDSFS